MLKNQNNLASLTLSSLLRRPVRRARNGGAALSGDIVEQVMRAAISTLVDALIDGG